MKVFVTIALALFALASVSHAQKLPDKIRGYNDHLKRVEICFEYCRWL